MKNKFIIVCLLFLVGFISLSLVNAYVFVQPTENATIRGAGNTNVIIQAVATDTFVLFNEEVICELTNGYCEFLFANTEFSEGYNSIEFQIIDQNSDPYTVYMNIYYYSDDIPPKIEFVFPTENSGTNISYNFIYINLTNIETNFKNITYRLYNTTSYVNITTYLTNIQNINFTNLQNTQYFYNVTSCDLSGNCNFTETRNITINEIPNIPSSTCSPLTPVLLDFLAIALAASLILWIFIATENPDKMTNRIVFTLVLIIIILGTKTAIC